MKSSSIRSIAILGAGPAGCALAIMAQRRGVNVYLFDDQKKPDLLVGESLVPAAMPILQRLGVTEKVAAIAQEKRGAALRHNSGARVDFEFKAFGRDVPGYAFNIPRPQFDFALQEQAAISGVNIVPHRAKLDLGHLPKENEVQLDKASLTAAGLTAASAPDLIVDATGRTRYISRLLSLPEQRGTRNDVAYFAHFKHFDSGSTLPGQVVISVLEHGWSWQIPLPGCTSVGVVIDKETIGEYGSDPQSRLSQALRRNPLLAQALEGSEQISAVKTYANYQLITQKSSGPGWVLLGDAFGFVDPMLSPGVFMALQSAQLLDQHLFAKSTLMRKDLSTRIALYHDEVMDWHVSWQRLIEFFYDGRMLSLGEVRASIHEGHANILSRMAEPLVSRMLAQMVGGVATRSKFKQKFLQHSCDFVIKDSPRTALLAIRAAADDSPHSRRRETGESHRHISVKDAA